MDEIAEFPDWELLMLDSSSDRSSNPEIVEDDDSEDGAIKHDYFSLLPSGDRCLFPAPDFESASEDSDGRSWIDPDPSAAGDARRHGGDLRFPPFAAADAANTNGYWSDASPSPPESEKGDEFGGLVSSTAAEEGSEGTVGGDYLSDPEVEVGELGLGGLAMGEGDGGLRMPEVGDGEERPVVWWKLPIELLKVCVLKAKPASWTVSFAAAAAIVGTVMLARKLYRMRKKSRSFPLKIAIDEKRASVFMARVARLNEALSVANRLPVVRQPSLPVEGVVPWPVLGLALI